MSTLSRKSGNGNGATKNPIGTHHTMGEGLARSFTQKYLFSEFFRLLKTHPLAFEDTDSAYESKEWAEKSYALFSKSVKSLNYSAKNVEAFVSSLIRKLNAIDDEYVAEIEGAKAGLLLSALVNNFKETDFIFDFTGLQSNLKYFAWENEGKNLVITCNDPYRLEDVATGMKSGHVVINADVAGSVGFEQEGGDIEFNGNALCIGSYLSGGHIVVKSTPSQVAIGDYATGGSIVLMQGIADSDKIKYRSSIGEDADGVEITSLASVYADIGPLHSGKTTIDGDVYGSVGCSAQYPETELMKGGEIGVSGYIHGKVLAFAGKISAKGADEVKFCGDMEKRTAIVLIDGKPALDLEKEEQSLDSIIYFATQGTDEEKKSALDTLIKSKSPKGIVMLGETLLGTTIGEDEMLVNALNPLAMEGKITSPNVLLRLIQNQCEVEVGMCEYDPSIALDFNKVIPYVSNKKLLNAILTLANKYVNPFKAVDPDAPETPEIRNLITLAETRLSQF